MMKRDVLIVVLSTAAYGAVLAAWRSPLMAAYVAVKLPVVFVATTLVVSAFCWAAGLLCRAGLRYREVLGAVFSAMAVAGSILLALSPVVLYFVFSGAPDAGTREEMRFAHATMMMVHILVLACAGATGNLVLCRALRRRVPPERSAEDERSGVACRPRAASRRWSRSGSRRSPSSDASSDGSCARLSAARTSLWSSFAPMRSTATSSNRFSVR